MLFLLEDHQSPFIGFEGYNLGQLVQNEVERAFPTLVEHRYYCQSYP